MEKGKVYLVGAGPGDVELITVKGLNAIKHADVILYDRLANGSLLEHVSENCELIFAGKLPHRHFLKQEEINELLVEKALEGKTVVRLKGGDPGVFGRVGEEGASLAANGIEYEVIPGVTAGIAAPMYAGVPITHKKYGVSFAIISAHDTKADINWEALAKGVDTLVFYMGVSNLAFITEQLIRFGKPSDTPVLLIQWGTYSRQKTLEGTLDTITNLVAQTNFTNPAITLVGNIVELRKNLSWFEQKPLFGRQILLGRTGTEESKVAKALREKGADVFEFPKWKRTLLPPNPAVLQKLETYEQILFTSPESVKDFFQILIEQNRDCRKIKAELYGASSKSIHAIREKGFLAQGHSLLKPTALLVVGEQNNIEKQSEYVKNYGRCDVFPTSRKELDERLWLVWKQRLDEATIDSIVFPSAAAVDVVLANLEKVGYTKEQLLGSSNVYCMGPVSRKSLTKWSSCNAFVCEEPTVDALMVGLMQS